MKQNYNLIVHCTLYIEHCTLISGGFMTILTTDLDNTLIYSYKHDIGEQKRCAEIYQGREISFITDRTYEMLRELSEQVRIIPITTRTREQYERIDLGIGGFDTALVCNGGVLIENGEENREWYEQSRRIIEKSDSEINRAIRLMEKDSEVFFEIRYIRGLFVFTKSNTPEQTAQRLKNELDSELLDIFTNGTKVYAVPKGLDKGLALRRIRERLGADKIIAAGDSEFDIPMLRSADIAVCPKGLAEGEGVISCGEDQLLAEFMLKAALDITGSKQTASEVFN